MALLDDVWVAGAVALAVAVADGPTVTGMAVVIGMYHTLPLEDAEAVRLVGSDWPLDNVVVMVDITVVEATESVDVEVGEGDDGLPEATDEEVELWTGCCCP